MPTGILALDLATRSGFAFGFPGEEPPISGSIRFASPGATHEAIFAAAITWTINIVQKFNPDLVVWEAPIPASFKNNHTNVGTSGILFGLPAIIGGVCHLRKIYDVRMARTTDVRLHFLGESPKRAIAKRLTMRQCAALGWNPEDDNEADALATWHYMASIIEPKLAIRPLPLFGRARL